MQLLQNNFYIIRLFITEENCDPVHFAHDCLTPHGTVFVDDKEAPNSVLLKHFCGFSFPLGNAQNPEFNHQLHTLLKTRKETFMFCLPQQEWAETLLDFSDLPFIPGKHIALRLNTKQFHIEHYPIPSGYQLQPIDALLYEKLSGLVFPKHYWLSAEDFLQSGYGLCLIGPNGEIVSSSFSSCVANGFLDIGIQTEAGYEGHGFATVTAARMVEYSLKAGLQPVWGCNAKNITSYRVAEKLGFEKYSECMTLLLKEA